MRRITMTALAGVLAAATFATGAANAGGNNVERPYKGTEAGTTAIDFTGCVPGESTLTCPLDTVTTDAKLSHLGKIAGSSSGFITLHLEEACTLIGGDIGIVFTAQGDGVFVAANGDELHLTYENTGCAAPPGEEIPTAINGSQTITGGTGRFSDATGSTITSGIGMSDTYVLTWTGTITY